MAGLASGYDLRRESEGAVLTNLYKYPATRMDDSVTLGTNLIKYAGIRVTMEQRAGHHEILDFNQGHPSRVGHIWIVGSSYT
jgi:hypothetical protein